jgi:hypothetical protein
LKAEIDRTDFFNEAASGALNLNSHILEKYRDVAVISAALLMFVL